MTESRRIQDQLDRSFQGPAWHGPSLMENLNGLTVAQAGARPVEGAHTIGELVLHLTVWMRIVWRTLEGDPYPDWKAMKPEEDWPPVGEATQATWEQALAAIGEMHQSLSAATGNFPEARLAEKVAGQPFNYYGLLHGAVQHNVYHAGQIGIVKKA